MGGRLRLAARRAAAAHVARARARRPRLADRPGRRARRRGPGSRARRAGRRPAAARPAPPRLRGLGRPARRAASRGVARHRRRAVRDAWPFATGAGGTRSLCGSPRGAHSSARTLSGRSRSSGRPPSGSAGIRSCAPLRRVRSLLAVPQRILVGHGAGVHDGADEALHDAVQNGRRRLPAAFLNALRTSWSAASR